MHCSVAEEPGFYSFFSYMRHNKDKFIFAVMWFITLLLQKIHIKAINYILLLPGGLFLRAILRS